MLRRTLYALLGTLACLTAAAPAFAPAFADDELIQEMSNELNSLLAKGRARLNTGSCVFGNDHSCDPEEVCVRKKSGTECIRRFSGSTPLIRFPFEPAHPVVCIQAPRDTRGDHVHEATLDAIDLASPPSGAPGKVFAAIDGIALVHTGCAPRSPGCGHGRGNHVRLLNKDGIMVLYAHLESVRVEEGQSVHQGELIGVEGSSGDARSRQLHFSVHSAPLQAPGKNWVDWLSWYRERPASLPPSIPFETQYCDPAQSSTGECHRKRSRMDRLPCSGKASEALRADWRS